MQVRVIEVYCSIKQNLICIDQQASNGTSIMHIICKLPLVM